MFGAFTLGLALTGSNLALAAVDTAGFTELQGRWFPRTGQSRQQEKGLNESFAVQPEWRYRSADRRQYWTFIPFARWDADDSERSHADIREAHWLGVGDTWELLIGVNRVFWGVAESQHLVDIINQTDAIEDIDGEDKLGQPMVELTALRDWGDVSAFLLPGFRERTFPGESGRLRTRLPVDTDEAQYRNGASEDRIDLAVRYSHAWDDWDLGLAWFFGNGREPRLVPNSTGTRLLPVYERISQFSGDLQLTREAWLWKLETLVRSGQGNTFWAMVGGLEYTFYQIVESAADLGLLLEYHRDERDNEAPPTVYDDDLYIGTRLVLNDTASTELLAGVLVDRNTQAWSFNLEAERRLTDHVLAEVRARAFGGGEPPGIIDQLSQDDYLQVALRYYF